MATSESARSQLDAAAALLSQLRLSSSAPSASPIHPAYNPPPAPAASYQPTDAGGSSAARTTTSTWRETMSSSPLGAGAGGGRGGAGGAFSSSRSVLDEFRQQMGSRQPTIGSADRHGVSDSATAYLPRGAPAASQPPIAVPSVAAPAPPSAPPIPYPDESHPVVPPHHMARLKSQPSSYHHRFPWEQHICAPIVLALLQRRGVQHDLHRELVEYHMAESFLDLLVGVSKGCYFVRYELESAPKQRFYCIQMLPNEYKRNIPYLCWYIHHESVQMTDKVPIEDVVGISFGHRPLAFRRHLVSSDLLRGCFDNGNKRTKLSVQGCFTLWFCDRSVRKPRALHLLQTNLALVEQWALVFRGILAVNSTCLSGDTEPAQEMARLMAFSQSQLMGEDEPSSVLDG